MIINEIDDKYYQNKLWSIIHHTKGESRLSELKQYVIKHSYFKKFGHEPAWLAYQIYIESLKQHGE
jgi:hypothetical protein